MRNTKCWRCQDESVRSFSMLRSRSRAEKAALVARFRAELLPAFDSGALHVTVDSTFPPERAAEAFQRMRDNRSVGKILIVWRRE